MKNNINHSKIKSGLIVWVLTFSFVLSLQSCARVPVIYHGDDNTRVDFAAVVANFPEYKNAPLPQDITPLTQQNILAETARQRSAALSSPKPTVVGDSRYRIGVNDILHITVWDHPELSYNAADKTPENLKGSVVSIDGTIFYPYVGTVEVLGLTVEQIRMRLTKLLSATIEKPQLEVRVSDYRSQKAFVGGEVQTPGMQKISDIPLTLLDAINNAGGASDMADLDNASLTRRGEVYKLNLNELFTSGNKDLNVDLLDGDVLSIPNITESKYYVLGHVTNPIHKELSNINKMLFDAIEEAGGVKPVNEDSLHPAIHYFVVRGTNNGPDDIVYVTSERPSNWNLVYQQILQYANIPNQNKAL